MLPARISNGLTAIRQPVDDNANDCNDGKGYQRPKPAGKEHKENQQFEHENGRCGGFDERESELSASRFGSASVAKTGERVDPSKLGGGGTVDRIAGLADQFCVPAEGRASARRSQFQGRKSRSGQRVRQRATFES